MNMLTIKFCAIFLLTVFAVGTAYGKTSSVVIENDYFRYEIGADGRNLSFIDKVTGIDYFDNEKESHCGFIGIGGEEYSVSSIFSDGKRITMEFGEPGVRAVLEKTQHEDYVVLEVIAINGGDVDSLKFVTIPLKLEGIPGEPFAACALSLNIFTRVRQLPAMQTELWAACFKKFGLIGAKAAITGVPTRQILDVLKKVITDAEELPKTTVSGPWAKEIPFNKGSYMFNFGDLTEENVDEWIEMVQSVGFNQVDHHGGSRFFRWGDFQLDQEKWPDGWDSMKRIVGRLNDAGIGSIFHSYCTLIDKNSKYATPIPHQHLDAYGSFTLAKPLTADATEIEVLESTADVSTITGFFVHNSVTLHLGDELIIFSGVTKEAPYKFTGCTRGAHGTTVSSYDKDRQARHLKQIVGLFIPDADSPLLEEIAKTQADIINYCGFKGMYFDAHGGGLLKGREYTWYYATKFIYLVWKHLDKPLGMEFGDMHHHWWQLRSRCCSLDYPKRGYRRFIDEHVASVHNGLLLPKFLGWWSFHTWSPPQVEPTYPDVMEYLGCKLIANDAGLSLHGGIDRESYAEYPANKRIASILKHYENLKNSNYFDESIKAKLREPGRDFTLFLDTNGRWRFRPTFYGRHKVNAADSWSSSWDIKNPYRSQPLKLRIEALMSAGAYDAPESLTLFDISEKIELPERLAAEGVTFELQSSSEQVKTGTKSASFTARNSGIVNQNSAWIKAGRIFEPLLDLSRQQALGVWIYGDGKGELINFRLKSPDRLTFGAIADHYVTVDFTGWRYFELIETESTRHRDYDWPEGSALYGVYREEVDYENIESFDIWYNNLPPNEEVNCFISPVKAIPMVEGIIKNPEITINGKTIVFPVEMKSGSYLEFNSISDCKLYGPKGELLAEVTPGGEVPELGRGDNAVTFSCDEDSKLNIRANVTVISYDEPL